MSAVLSLKIFSEQLSQKLDQPESDSAMLLSTLFTVNFVHGNEIVSLTDARSQKVDALVGLHLGGVLSKGFVRRIVALA